MSAKLIILYEAEYCNKQRSLYDVDYLIQRKYDVEYWNLSNITLHSHLSKVETPGLIERDIKDMAHFRQLLCENVSKKCLYISVFNYCDWTHKIYFWLSYYNCRFGLMTTGPIPSPGKMNSDQGFLKRIKDALKWRYYMSIVKLPCFKPAYCVLNCANRSSHLIKENNKTLYFNTNSGDYQQILNFQKSKADKVRSNDYIVFMDQNVCFHYELDLYGFNKLNPDYYFDRINKYFDLLEERYNCKVVIAAHPSSVKYKEKDYFNGREVYYSKTLELVAGALGAVTHNTTAVSFAVAYNKPVIFTTLPEFSQYFRDVSYLLANEISSKVVDISKDGDCVFEPIDVEAYRLYKKNYLTSCENDVNNGVILARILDTL